MKIHVNSCEVLKIDERTNNQIDFVASRNQQ
jgi:hypothetical protein